MRLYLASTSPARLAVLRAAGIEPVVCSSGVGERAVIAAIEAERGPLTAAEMVVTLAEAKAEAVAGRAGEPSDGTPAHGTPSDGTPAHGTPSDGTPADRGAAYGPIVGGPNGGTSDGRLDQRASGGRLDARASYGGPGSRPGDGGLNGPGDGILDGFILGGDSVFEFDGRIYGKPHTAEIARARWQRQRGGEGILWSGLCLIDHRGGVPHGRASGVDSAAVRFESEISDQEIDAYIATGEPLNVAGAFTIDSLGAPLVAAISGAPSTVVGLSIPLLRRMLRDDFGMDWPTSLALFRSGCEG